ncbi:phage holin family protein [Paenibacillus filicis]|uniref:Phage holin family protein n=1 Tax=Paenibacillus gyeongsangnamensis TaxID=3388067 RepID=A0ABT4Q9G2_9BACL|nr:phage holin family protein [Paenibacillus filicis]MCZ8513463.1 phage holin family protein [Paenibacillus filicis]
MDWTTVMNLIEPKLMTVAAACWVLGSMLKQTPMAPDWSIVYIVSAFALTCSVWTAGLTPESLLQGMLCAAAAVYGNRLLKQGKKVNGESGGRHDGKGL